MYTKQLGCSSCRSCDVPALGACPALPNPLTDLPTLSAPSSSISAVWWLLLGLIVGNSLNERVR